ncbi:MAG: hypothetical protein R2705_20980 [Ilumatobacteraceae bacterium]
MTIRRGEGDGTAGERRADIAATTFTWSGMASTSHSWRTSASTGG